MTAAAQRPVVGPVGRPGCLFGAVITHWIAEPSHEVASWEGPAADRSRAFP